MYAQLSAVPLTSTKNVGSTPIRRSANYHPSIWRNHFLAYASQLTDVDDYAGQQVQELKEEVRKILIAISYKKPSEKLQLIDAIQRLGVSYHFETEIESALKHMNDKDDADLHTVALHFRLLRQQGHNVSCDVFDKFTDANGKFKGSLMSDVRGMLSLYEATHLRVHGEEILDEALTLTTIQLESMIPNLSNSLAAEVFHALKQPIHQSLTRLEARRYISSYQKDGLHNEVLLKFAKLDFNILQKMHQRELSGITRWWKDLDVANKLPFARDRVVECYFWILGVYFEPQYSLARRILTKVISMTSIIDDIYDVYGTIEELVLFTDAIESWHISALDQLPEYMRHCYRALLDVYSEIEDEMIKEGRSFGLHYAKAGMKRTVRAYLEEVKWFHKGYVPTLDEYMKVALVSGAYTMLATTSFVGMGELVTKEAFDWVSNDPLIVRASSIMSRLMNDMVGHEFEQERGHVASAVECYMKEHGTTKLEALAEFNKQVTNAWKDMNQECLYPTVVPMPLLVRILNLARVANLFYKDEEGYTHSKTRTKHFITSVLIDSVPI